MNYSQNLSRFFTVQLSMFVVVISNSLYILSCLQVIVNNFFIFLCCRSFAATLISYHVCRFLSSKLDLTIDEKTICFGEVGLSGEVRGVSMAEQRVAEAAKLGFEVCILPKVSLPSVGKKYAMKLIGVANVREALDAIQA